VSENSNKRRSSFTLVSFLLRVLFALALVLVTYNPSSYSYSNWVINAVTLGPEHAVAGVALIGGWLVFVRATLSSLGGLGLIVCTAFIATLVWWLVDAGWLSAVSITTMEWVTLVGLAVLLGIGMSWSHIRRRLTGQYDVDDVDD
jgi:Family of unknown function (DUF6524)